MASTRALMGTTSSSTIQNLLWNAWNESAPTIANMKTRRMLVSRDPAAWGNAATGTLIPHPYNDSPVTVRTMIGEGAKAAYISASRLTANQPDIAVIPLSATADLNVTTSRKAGEQERLDAQLWHESGGSDCQWQASWAKSIGGAAFWLTLPRDADFGLPDREYYDEDDDEIAMLRSSGKVAAAPYGVDRTTGKLVYAEHGDVWANRRKMKMKDRAISGRSLFSLNVYPRDMVLKERDREQKDLKWAAIVEEIPVSDCAPGSDFAYNLATAKKIDPELRKNWGVFWDADHKRIIGGISAGGPINSQVARYDAFTLIRFFDREEMVILIAPRGSVQGAVEVYRGKHGCKVQGNPACPVVEDPFYRTDINVTGKEYATALDPVFAWLAPINQLMILKSQVAAYNSTPRMVGELHENAEITNDDGQPISGNSSPIPGLSAKEIAWFQGKVSILKIDDASMTETLQLALDELHAVMPSFGSDGAASDGPAWGLQMRIQEQQEPYREPVRNGCQAVTGIIQRWHGWMRSLDVPVCFFPTQGRSSDRRVSRGLIEFNPKDLVDSIRVTQSVNTSAEATVNEQIATEKWQLGLIDDYEYYEMTGVQDADEAVRRRVAQQIVNYVTMGALPPLPPGGVPGGPSLIQMVGDGVRGEVHFEMIRTDDNYAIATAQALVQQAQQASMQTGMPDGEGNIGEAAGVAVPGVGMATTLQQQLGPSVPGGQGAQQPVSAV